MDTTAYDNLVKFWRKYIDKGWKDIHPDDHLPEDFSVANITGISEYVESRYFLDKGTTIYSRLLPAPYCGDLMNAKVYFLLLNPGFAPIDLYLEEKDQACIETLKKNLAQEETEDPFMPLNPSFCWTSGATWWFKKLKPVFELYRKGGKNNFYACKDMSKKIAALELFPYHSASFHQSKKLGEIESVKLIKAFAKGLSKDKSKLLIVMRQIDEWKLEEAENAMVFPPKYAQSGSLNTPVTEMEHHPGARKNKSPPVNADDKESTVAHLIYEYLKEGRGEQLNHNSAFSASSA